MQNNAGSDRRWIEGKDVRLADEIRYIQQRAAERDTRIVTIGPLLLFSAESGDAWILDPADRLTTRLAEGGNPRLVRVEETEESFAVGWQGRYGIIGSAFVFSDNESGRVTTILGTRPDRSSSESPRCSAAEDGCGRSMTREQQSTPRRLLIRGVRLACDCGRGRWRSIPTI